jgi:hypothetical protein
MLSYLYVFALSENQVWRVAKYKPVQVRALSVCLFVCCAMLCCAVLCSVLCVIGAVCLYVRTL